MEDMRRLQFYAEAMDHNRRELLKTGICAGLGLVISTGSFSCCPCSSDRKQVMLDSDDFSMIAYCCLECEKCEVYIATQNNDEKLRAKVAKE